MEIMLKSTNFCVGGGHFQKCANMRKIIKNELTQKSKIYNRKE